MKTLLLVDDDREVLCTLNELLSKMDLRVIAKPDAKAALSLLREGVRIDLIITDYRMPETDGLEFLLLAKRLLPDVPVIMLTGYGEVETYLKAVNLGVFEYMNKPVKMKELCRIVQAALASVEERSAACRDEAGPDGIMTGPPSRAQGKQRRCRFMFGTHMVSCGRNREVYVPSTGELRDYCETALHTLCPRYLRDEAAPFSDDTAHKHWKPASSLRVR